MLKSIISVLFLLNIASAQVVIDPTGSEKWKTLSIKVIMDEEEKLPDARSKSGRFICQTQLSISLNMKRYSIVLNGESYTYWEEIIPFQDLGLYNISISYLYGRAPYSGFLIADSKLNTKKETWTAFLGRIDIKDTLIEKDDGTKYEERGIVSVYHLGKDRMSLLCKFPTGHGLSVLKGERYYIEVKTNGEDGTIEYSETLSL